MKILSILLLPFILFASGTGTFKMHGEQNFSTLQILRVANITDESIEYIPVLQDGVMTNLFKKNIEWIIVNNDTASFDGNMCMPKHGNTEVTFGTDMAIFKFRNSDSTVAGAVISKSELYDSTVQTVGIVDIHQTIIFPKDSIEWFIYKADTLVFINGNCMRVVPPNEITKSGITVKYGLYYEKSDFLYNSPDSIDVSFVKDSYSNVFPNYQYNEVQLFDEDRKQWQDWSNLKDDTLWGFCDGTTSYIYTPRGFSEIHIFKDYSWFITEKLIQNAAHGTFDNPMTTAYSERIEGIALIGMRKGYERTSRGISSALLSKRTLKKLLEQVPELYQEFNNSQIEESDYGIWLNRLFTTLDDRGEAVKPL